VLDWLPSKDRMEHVQHIAGGHIWELVLVKVLNLFHTALQYAFIFGLLRKLSVSIVKHSMPVLLAVSSGNPTPRGHITQK